MTALHNRTDINMPSTASESNQRIMQMYKKLMTGVSADNPTGKNYKDFTAADFAKLSNAANPGIITLIWMSNEEEYGVIDALKPTRMSRIEFHHVLLREAAKRDLLDEVVTGDTLGENKTVTVQRPLTVPMEQRAEASVKLNEITMRDTVVRMLNNPAWGAAIVSPDVAKQIGLPDGETIGYDVKEDMRALTIGYVVGANPNFARNGKLPLEIWFNTTKEEQQKAFCAGANAIAKEGRAVDQTVAVSTGLLMAREDAKTAFSGLESEIGIHGAQCGTANPSWNTNYKVALQGVDKSALGRN